MSEPIVDIHAFVNVYDQIEQELEWLSDHQLKWKAAPESWSVTEVLAHLVDHSIIVSFRIREILSGSETRLPSFKQDAWVSGQRANEGDVKDILLAARSLVQYNSLLFNRLTEEEWSKTGINFKGEPVSIAVIVPAFVKHVQGHLGQIRRIKQGELDSRN
ncbi:DinB family protein [Paenibacillus sp. 2TAB26]|uniref:DinB family protein n=1 Tax=Paenibacillus sp. 2TAB26 TaxID=3233005 RepID=UPI003F9DBBCC